MGVSDLLPYHASLRVLGQMLDAEGASFLTLCEIHGGFLLQSLAGGDPCALRSRVLAYGEVLDAVERWEPVTRGERPRGVRFWPMGGRGPAAEHRPPPPPGYADRFHALGHALEGRTARAVTMAELDDATVQVEYTVERAMTVFRHGQRLVAHGRYAQHYTTAQLDAAAQARTAQITETVRRAGRHLAENPTDIRACLAGAAALEEAGDLAEAERLYRQAVALVPLLGEAHYHLAHLAFRRGDLAAALHHLRPATTEETGDSRPFYLLGRLHERRREPVAAVGALEQALARDPENPLYAFALERLRESAGGAQSGEVPCAAPGTSTPDNAFVADVATRGADSVPCASAAVCREAAPVPRPAGVRPELSAPDVGRAAVPGADHSVALSANQALGDARAPGGAPLDDLPGDASWDGPPNLGWAAATAWERPAWPSLDGPVASATAAAARPFALASLLHQVTRGR